jgi:hypothetical protein
MNPETFAQLLAEYGPPAEIAGALACEGPRSLEEPQLLLADLRRFELPQEATETVSTIAWHLITAQRLMATLPALLAPAEVA